VLTHESYLRPAAPMFIEGTILSRRSPRDHPARRFDEGPR